MTPHKFRLVFYALLSLLLMALIFYLSSQPAPQSQRLSDGLLYKILSSLGFEDEGEMEFYGKLIRKVAHFAEYAALGLSLMLFFTELSGNTQEVLRLGAARGFALCAMYAVSDELHQYFIPGRSMQLSDVLLDWSGSLAAVFFLFVLKKYIYSHREERKNFE